MSKNPIRKVTMEELKRHLKQTVVVRNITEVFLHHSWRPTGDQFRGLSTWEAIDTNHEEVRGWAGGIGYHLGIDPQGGYWLLRPLARSGAHVLNRNANSIGVCIIGDYDTESTAAVLLPAARLFAVLLEHYKLPLSAVRFHREMANKSCPGKNFALGEFRERVAEALRGEPVTGQPVVIVVGVGAEPEMVVRGAEARVEAGGKLRADVRPLLEGLGYKVHAEHLATQGKLYVEPPGG